MTTATAQRRPTIPATLHPEAVTAVIDTREQIPLDLSPLQVEPGTLTTGDYSVKGLESIVAVERKSLPDLLGCIGQHRERFDREVMRLLAYPTRAMVAARVREHYAAAAKERQESGKSADGTAGGRGHKKTLVTNESKVSSPRQSGQRGRASDEAGKAVGVSGMSVDRARIRPKSGRSL